MPSEVAVEKKKGYTPEEFAELLGLGYCTIYRWIAKDFLRYINRRVPGPYARRIKSLWDKTCTPSEAARMLGVSPSKVDTLLKEGVFQTIIVVSKPRIFLKSVEKIRKKGFLVKKGDVIHPKKNGFARLSKERQSEIAQLGNKAKKKRSSFDPERPW